MKKYKVLEAHQGDKFYIPGDGETGTRIADENDVGHLVALGLLEEVGDAPDAVVEPASGDGALTGLRDEVRMLTEERDNARADLNALGSVLQGERDTAEALRGQVSATSSERDDLTSQLASVSTERDNLREQLAAVTGERDAHAARVTALEGELASKTGNGQRPARRP